MLTICNCAGKVVGLLGALVSKKAVELGLLFIEVNIPSLQPSL